VAIDWQQVQASQGKRGDIVLEDGDVVVIPHTPTLVLVAGAVENQGPIRYQPGMRVQDAINRAGGLGKDAVLRSAIIIRLNGQVIHVSPRDGVQPGDIVMVPTKYIIQKSHDKSQLERALAALADVALLFRVF
jgi:protein involved in polysaccharide export with SLBB domain